MKIYKRVIPAFVVVALALAGCGALPASVGLSSSTSALADLASAPVAQATVPSTGSLQDLQNTFEQVYQQVSPSVVSIQVVESAPASTSFQLPGSPFVNPFGNQSPQQVQQALGSGFVWDQQGHIVTNNHVVSGASQISVTFADGTTYDAKLVGADSNSDLAVIQVSAPNEKLQPVTLADSNQVKVGQLVAAIGNPFGLEGTMTQGIISGLARSLDVGLDNSSASSGPHYAIPDIIQTDAPINPGNSGGVLVDMQGRVVGVTAAIASTVQANSGVGFVIPSAIVQKVVPALIQTGHFDHSWLGITGTTLTPDLSKAMSISSDQTGVLVVNVTSGSPAARAGLRGGSRQASVQGQSEALGGDVITAVNNQPIKSFEDLLSYLFNETQVGQKVTLTILRNGSQQQVEVTLGKLPDTVPAQ